LIAELRAQVGDLRVLAAIAAIPRERFVAAADTARAYENAALPIAGGQTISQPTVVARMLDLLELEAEDRVLDIGTGSGYHAALLARLVREVWTVERIPELSHAAARRLGLLGITNVHFVSGDGTLGLPEHGRFDAINVAAASPQGIPPALEDQLADGGRLVAPVGGETQHLVLVRRTPGGLIRMRLDPVRFVPLLRDTR
jgi:protein-L-isoaspartate(D-aspartate) O-methyltransferase